VLVLWSITSLVVATTTDRKERSNLILFGASAFLRPLGRRKGGGFGGETAVDKWRRNN